MKDQMKWIITAVVALALVLAIAGTAFFFGTRSSEEDRSAQQPPASTTSAVPDVESEGNLPGATIGNSQRTWPDPTGRTDDSAHRNPGQYSVDISGNPVWTPKNHDGDFPSAEGLDTGTNVCNEGAQLPGQTQIQYVNGRYMVVNDQAGPTELSEGIPTGYAKSPAGAVVAAMNLTTYGMPMQTDEIGIQVMKKLWNTSASTMSDAESQGIDLNKPDNNQRALLAPAPVGFRIMHCSEKVATVEIATLGEKSPSSDQHYWVYRIPMFLRDGDWVPDFTGAADRQLSQPEVTSLDEFVKVEYK